MSLKNIKSVLEWVRRGDTPDELAAALAEVEAIEKAARDLTTPQNPKEKAHRLLSRISREST